MTAVIPRPRPRDYAGGRWSPCVRRPSRSTGAHPAHPAPASGSRAGAWTACGRGVRGVRSC